MLNDDTNRRRYNTVYEIRVGDRLSYQRQTLIEWTRYRKSGALKRASSHEISLRRQRRCQKLGGVQCIEPGKREDITNVLLAQKLKHQSD